MGMESAAEQEAEEVARPVLKAAFIYVNYDSIR